MPPPFSTHHNAFLLNYIEHGRTKVLNKFSKAFALHKNGFLVSVELFVREVSAFSVEAAGIGGDGSGGGGGSSTSFLGVLKPIYCSANDQRSAAERWCRRQNDVGRLRYHSRRCFGIVFGQRRRADDY